MIHMENPAALVYNKYSMLNSTKIKIYNHMKKILFVADYVYLGGGEIILLDLITNLKRLNFDAILIIPKKGPLLYEAKNRSIDTRIVDMPPIGKKMIKYPLRFVKSILRLIWIVKREKIKYVFANNLNAGIYASIAAKPFGIKSIWYCWAHIFPKDRFWQYMYRFLFDKIVFCSHFLKEKMRINTFKQNELIVSYPGIDANRFDGDNAYFENLFKTENRIWEGYHIFSIIGRLDGWKNHLMFLDVASEIVRYNPNSYFVIAGGYTENEGSVPKVKLELDRKIKDMPSIAGKIMFTGFVKDVRKIIKSSKIIFSCSGTRRGEESFGLTLVEAMISGRPVIATAIGGPREIIIDGFNGFLVKPGDYKAMAKKAIDLMNSPSEYNNIVDNARRYAVERYAAERFAKEILDIYAE